MAVAETPRLACLVSELEWQEMYADGSDLANIPKCGEEDGEDGEDDIAHLQELARQEADSVFWLPPSKAREALTLAHLQDRVAQIKSALERMPGITDFSYRYKQPHCVVGDRYPFSVGSIHAHVGSINYVGGYCGPVAAIFSRLLRADSRLAKLVWAGHSELVDFGEVVDSLPSPPMACTLTTLHLDLDYAPSEAPSLQGRPSPGISERFSKLKSLLGTAKNLRELRIQSSYGVAGKRNAKNIFDMLLAGPDALTLPHLHTFQLIDTPFRPAAFAAFVQRHRSTLRHLLLKECFVCNTDLGMLADIQGMQLESLCVLLHGASVSISQERLLEYINGGNASALTSHGFVTMKTHRLVEKGGRREVWPEGDVNDSDAGSVQGIPIDSSINSDEDEMASMDSQDVRQMEAPLWTWGRFGGALFYWPAAPDRNPYDVVQETLYWRFTDRNGVRAYGKDPLDFFEEWDTDLGDVAEPTPYGMNSHESPYARQKISFFGLDDRQEHEPPKGARMFDDGNMAIEREWHLV